MLTRKLLIAGVVASLTAVGGCSSQVTSGERTAAGAQRPLTPPSRAIDVAITIDDLPRESSTPGLSSIQIASQMLDVLVRHGVPQVYGFTNGYRLTSEPSDRAVLTAWVKAGYPLGNHTYSHIDLRRVPLNEFLSDVERNEALLVQEMGQTRAGEWKMLRFPFGVEGTDLASHATILQWAREHQYRIAPVTVDFWDWAYQAANVRCLRSNNTASLTELRRRYLNAAAASIEWSSNASQALFGRQVRQIALFHLNGFSASMMDEYLSSLEHRGAHFISLDEALADPLYASEPNPPVAWTGSFFDLVVAAHPRVRLPRHPPSPSVSDLCPES